MTNIYPPHDITDEDKFLSMIETLENGGQLPPVVVYGDVAYTGSHRIAAWKAMELEPEIVELTEQEFILTVAKMNGAGDLDIDDPEDMEFYHKHLAGEIYDYNEFCWALISISDNDEVLNAVKDQV